MSAVSKIQWTDRTWNPVRGCSIVSPGCVNCYAMKQAHRFSGEGKPYDGLTKQTSAGPQWTGKIRLVEDALLEPLSWRKPARVFVNSMSDLFHEGVPDEFIDRVFAVMALAPQHTFQVLTKRPERMLAYMDGVSRYPAGHCWEHALRGFRVFQTKDTISSVDLPLRNVWLGVSVEDKPRTPRLDVLRQVPAAVRFISAEPLLEDLGALDLRDLHWVIVGGESGPRARPFDIAWARTIIGQCRAAGVPVFMKQIGSNWREPSPNGDPGLIQWTTNDRKGGDPSEWPGDIRVREFPA